MNDLANRRANCLSDVLRQSTSMTLGRLLLFDPDNTLSDEAATEVSRGFFDVHNAPAWDTWVWYEEDRKIVQGDSTIFASYLVAWVPQHVLDLAEAGIHVNPEECIRWATDVDTTFIRKLRIAGVLF